MFIQKIKQQTAGLLLRAATTLTPAPAPIILPASSTLPADDAERERLYDRIAYTALAWMAHAPMEARAAAASILKRTYPGISKHIADAHAHAIAFQPQLQELLRAEERQAQADEKETS